MVNNHHPEKQPSSTVEYEIRYKPSFATLFVTLSPGESITAEPGAAISMDSRIAIKTQFSGGFFSGLLKKWFGGESLLVNVFRNPTTHPLELVLSQAQIGDMACMELTQSSICLQPGAYIAHTPGIKITLGWAGFASWFAREGLFKLKLTGTGRVFFGAYGGLTPKRINGEFIIDNGHLVAYEPTIKMGISLSGGLFSSASSGEGFVKRLKGEGIIYLQSRSVEGLVKFLNPQFR
nr:TIGR00266 family protein [Laspinema sp. D3c]